MILVVMEQRHHQRVLKDQDPEIRSGSSRLFQSSGAGLANGNAVLRDSEQQGQESKLLFCEFGHCSRLLLRITAGPRSFRLPTPIPDR